MLFDNNFLPRLKCKRIRMLRNHTSRRSDGQTAFSDGEENCNCTQEVPFGIASAFMRLTSGATNRDFITRVPPSYIRNGHYVEV